MEHATIQHFIEQFCLEEIKIGDLVIVSHIIIAPIAYKDVTPLMLALELDFVKICNMFPLYTV
jgi:hypothetical protein